MHRLSHVRMVTHNLCCLLHAQIPIVATPSKKWTSSTESQKSDTSTWSQKVSWAGWQALLHA